MGSSRSGHRHCRCPQLLLMPPLPEAEKGEEEEEEEEEEERTRAFRG